MNKLNIIYDNGLCLKLQKCFFMQDEVVYLGFKINKNMIFPIKEETVALKKCLRTKKCF